MVVLEGEFRKRFRTAKNNLEFLERLGDLLRFKKELKPLAMEKFPSLSYWYEQSEEEVRNIVFMRFPKLDDVRTFFVGNIAI